MCRLERFVKEDTDDTFQFSELRSWAYRAAQRVQHRRKAATEENDAQKANKTAPPSETTNPVQFEVRDQERAMTQSGRRGLSAVLGRKQHGNTTKSDDEPSVPTMGNDSTSTLNI